MGVGSRSRRSGSASLCLTPVGSGAPIRQPAPTFCEEIRARLAALDAAAAPADGATLADSTVRTPGVDGHQLKLRAAGDAVPGALQSEAPPGTPGHRPGVSRAWKVLGSADPGPAARGKRRGSLKGAAQAAARHRLLKQKRFPLVYEPVPSREFTRAIGPRRHP